MDGNLILQIRDWPLKELTCLLPAASCTSTAVIAILGIFSDQRVPWSRRLVLALLLHPMNAIQGYVVMYFSLVHLSDFVSQPNCSKLVQMVVTSYLGVTVSTLAISLCRSSYLLLVTTTWAWSTRLESVCDSPGFSLSASLIFVAAVHAFTLTVSHIALPDGLWTHLRPNCTDLFTLTETTLPFIPISFCFMGTSLLLVVLSTILLAYGEKRRSQQTSTIVEIEDTFRDSCFIPPPNDGYQRQENLEMIASIRAQRNDEPGHELAAAGNALPLERRNLQTLDNRRQYLLQDGRFNYNNHSSNRRPEDFYDYEPRRHRAQSPPPMNLMQLQQANHMDASYQLPMNEFPQVDQANQDQVLPLPRRNQSQQTTDAFEIRDVENNARRFSISSSALELIFPHRSTIRNKSRFPYTNVLHMRNLHWSVRDPLNSRVHPTNQETFCDVAICISNLLYIVTYSLLGCYLIFSASDTPNPFLGSSLQVFVSLCMVKGTLESIVYITLINFSST
ncbi:hypothetical protein BsWGS_23163 [Bradybaena similaris]